MRGPESIQIEVVRYSDDGLRAERWRFVVRGWDLTLDRYTAETRATRRHKFVVQSVYDRLHPHGRRGCGGDGLATPRALSEIPFPPTVAEEARTSYLRLVEANLRVGTADMLQEKVE